MNIEDPDKIHSLEDALKQRIREIQNHFAQFRISIEAGGLSSLFIQNVISNLLNSASMALASVEPGESLQNPTRFKENLDLAEEYIKTLESNSEDLKTEAAIDFQTWIGMQQHEDDHARELVAKYNN